MIAKTWLADPATNTYGGVYLFASREALDAYLASEIARRAIGRAQVPPLRRTKHRL